MVTISSQEFERNTEVWQDRAQLEPVTICREDGKRLVLISADTYRHLRHRAREALPVGALSDADLDAIR